METVGLITGVISIFQTSLVNLFKTLVSSNIFNEEVRKSVNVLFVLVVSILIAYFTNLVINGGLPFSTILLIGTGIGFPVSQVAHRVNKVINS